MISGAVYNEYVHARMLYLQHHSMQQYPTQAIILLLSAVARSTDAEQRLAALHDIVAALCPDDAPPRFHISTFVQQPGWQDTVLELLVEGSPCLTPPSGKIKRTGVLPQRLQGTDWEWRGPELGAVRTILVALHVHCVRHVQHGWQHVLYTMCTLRALHERGRLDGWALAHEVCFGLE